jgi:hypothetical protein
VPTFEVSRSHGWYEAECRELGVTITARHLEQIEATARRTAARARGANAGVALVMAAKKRKKNGTSEGLLARLAAFLTGSRREGTS